MSMKYTLAKGLVKEISRCDKNNGEYINVKVNRKTGNIWGDYRIASDCATWGKCYEDCNVIAVGDYAGAGVMEEDIIKDVVEAVGWANAAPEDFII